jgi:uncharacterized protein YprB with RNaseH-like and TPR domain
MLRRERVAASDHLIVTLREWAMTTSSNEVTDDDLYEFLYCPQGYYLTYLIENGSQPANGVAPELLENLGRFYREYVKLLGERPMGQFVSEDILRKPDTETTLTAYIESLKQPDSVRKHDPKRLKLSSLDWSMLRTPDGLLALENFVRHIRQHGMPARICSKKKCICGCLADELSRIAVEHRHISILNGIGVQPMAALEDAGILSCEELLQTPTEDIKARLKEWGLPGTSVEVEKLKICARSYVENRTIVFGSIPPVGSSYIVLDTEVVQTDAYNLLIYLIGVCVVTGDKRKYHFLWADSENEEKQTLERLASLLKKHAQMPVVTWDGTRADFPRLQKVARWLTVESPLSAIAHHRDLYIEFDNAVRFPSRRFRLEDVAMRLGFTGERVERYVKRHGSLPKGEGDAFKLHDEYVRCGNLMAISDDLKKQVIEYNRDDLDMLIWISEKLPELKADKLKGKKK